MPGWRWREGGAEHFLSARTFLVDDRPDDTFPGLSVCKELEREPSRVPLTPSTGSAAVSCEVVWVAAT